MAERSDAFFALPGGLDTLEELFEILTWRQLGYQRRPIGILDTAGFFQPLLALLDHLQSSGFVDQVQRNNLIVEAVKKPSPMVGRGPRKIG